jgi:hypothetical protein
MGISTGWYKDFYRHTYVTQKLGEEVTSSQNKPKVMRNEVTHLITLEEVENFE